MDMDCETCFSLGTNKRLCYCHSRRRGIFSCYKSIELLAQRPFTQVSSFNLSIHYCFFFFNIINYYCRRATELLAIAILRNILGQYTLTDLLTNRVAISQAVSEEIDKGTAEWGVQVERVEM